MFCRDSYVRRTGPTSTMLTGCSLLQRYTGLLLVLCSCGMHWAALTISGAGSACAAVL